MLEKLSYYGTYAKEHFFPRAITRIYTKVKVTSLHNLEAFIEKIEHIIF